MEHDSRSLLTSIKYLRMANQAPTMHIAAYLATVFIALHCLIALAWQLRNRMLRASHLIDPLEARVRRESDDTDSSASAPALPKPSSRRVSSPPSSATP